MKKSIALIDDLIAIETERDRAHKAAAIKAGKGRQALGESQMLFHLKELRKLVEEESKPTLVSFTLPTGVANLNGDVFSPDVKFTVAPNIKLRQGCIGFRYCHQCKITYTASCLCMPVPCKQCNNIIGDTAGPENKEGWITKQYI